MTKISLTEARKRLAIIEQEIAALEQAAAVETAKAWPEGTPEFRTHYFRRQMKVSLPRMQAAAADGRAFIAANFPDA
jgi:hypothetical protein